MSIDFKSLAATLLQRSDSLLPQWFPEGKRRGDEFIVGSLQGERGESLSINTKTGKWADFATEARGTDLLSLYAASHNLNQGQAARELGLIEPDGAKREAFEFRVKDLGKPSRVWYYHDRSGQVVGAVARYETPQGKQIRPWKREKGKWVAGALALPRPLYGLPRLSDLPVVLAEGEKAADAAQAILADVYAVLTWQGGCKAWLKSDLTPLAGRDVLLWPDADKPGREAMNALAEKLSATAKRVRVLDTSNMPAGWDAADALAEGWDYAKFKDWAKPRVSLAVRPPQSNGEAIAEALDLASQTESAPANGTDYTSLVSRGAPTIFSPLPDESEGGRALSTVANVAEVLRRNKITVRYNVIAKEHEILIPGMGFSIDNRAAAALAWVTSVCAVHRVPLSQVDEYLAFIGDRNPYNPVAEWIDSKPWDGIDRIPAFCDTLHVAGECAPIRDMLMRKWLLSACAAAFSPTGVSAHGVLVLQGAQYIGKTAWFKTLAPPELGIIKDGLSLRPDDKDSVKRAVSYWLVELGELDATFRKADVSALKAFLTADKDVLRMPYARRAAQFARRTVFFASVNENAFLHDDTGNRRYWTLACEAIDFDHQTDMQQLWAQAAALYRASQSHLLTRDENLALELSNQQHRAPEPIEERVQTALDWGALTQFWTWKTATDVLLSIGMDHPTRGEATQAAHAIRRMNGNRARRSSGVNLLVVPPVRPKN